MARYACLVWAGGLVLLLGLACSDSGTQPKGIAVTFHQSACVGGSSADRGVVGGAVDGLRSASPSFQGPCLGGAWSVEARAPFAPGSVRFVGSHDTLFVFHDSAWYNCCSKIMYYVERRDSVINLVEVDTATDLCRCDCYFNLETYWSGLSRGMYTARLWTQEHDSLLGQAEVFIPGAGSVSFECRCDTLTVHDAGRLANCCSHIVFGFEVQGNVLQFTEIDSLAMPCKCLCNFDLRAQASGLAEGTYTVRLRSAGETHLLDSAVVQIAPCASE